MAVKIVVDSASDIGQMEASLKGLIVIPIELTFDKEEFLDGINLTPEQFYEKLIECDTLPKTSQINSFRFEELFLEHTKNGDELVVVTISSKLSGTYNSAVEAAKNFNCKVFVVDSLNATAGERLLAEYGLILAKEGKSAKEIANLLDNCKSKINVMAVIDTLEYLKKGGRISATAAFAGKLLGIKPVVGVVDGEVKVLGKARGSKNSENMLNSLVSEKGGIDFSMPFGTFWSGFDTTYLDKYIADSSHIWITQTQCVPKYILGATIGTHIGPGAIGVAFFSK